ncbi:MAG: hypothetical protein KDA33_08570, partial [Phycisphaerales bacterium]|nr:hypothetical protein [Phycisphaerales bacterium]
DRGDNNAQRRQIQTQLLAILNPTGTAWQSCATNVVLVNAENNSILKGQVQSLENYAPRIREGMERHRAIVEKKLVEERTNAWVQKKGDMEAAVIEARAAHDELSRQLRLALESGTAALTTTIAELKLRKDEITEQEAAASRLRDAVLYAERDLRIAEEGRLNLPTGTVKYERLQTASLGYFDTSKTPWAVLWGSVVTLVLYMLIWWLTRPRKLA